MLPTLSRPSNTWRADSIGCKSWLFARSCFGIFPRTVGCCIVTVTADTRTGLLCRFWNSSIIVPRRPNQMCSYRYRSGSNGAAGCDPTYCPRRFARFTERSRIPQIPALRDVARVGIGYVTGANEFFHLRPSEAKRARIPDEFLVPAVRNGRCLVGKAVTHGTVDAWRRRDEPMLLLRLRRTDSVPSSVREYLNSSAGKIARESLQVP